MSVDFSTLRPSTEGCVSDRVLDSLHLAALDPEATAAARAHLADCAHCAARFAEISGGFAADYDDRPVLAGVRRKLAQRAQRRWWLPAVLVVGAAAALLVVRAPIEGAADAGPALRIKGKAALRIYMQTPEGSSELAPDEPVAPGTHLKFGVDLSAAGAVRVLALSGEALVELVPPAQLPEGQGQVLPGAVQLDDAPGSERLFLLHCPGESSVPDCPLDGDVPSCPAPCTVTTRDLEKT